MTFFLIHASLNAVSIKGKKQSEVRLKNQAGVGLRREPKAASFEPASGRPRKWRDRTHVTEEQGRSVPGARALQHDPATRFRRPRAVRARVRLAFGRAGGLPARRAWRRHIWFKVAPTHCASSAAWPAASSELEASGSSTHRRAPSAAQKPGRCSGWRLLDGSP